MQCEMNENTQKKPELHSILKVGIWSLTSQYSRRKSFQKQTWYQFFEPIQNKCNINPLYEGTLLAFNHSLQKPVDVWLKYY